MLVKRRLASALAVVLALAILATAMFAAEPVASDSVVIFPARVVLSTKEARQTIVVQKRQRSQVLGQARDGLELISQNPQVAKVENGQVIPVANGETKVVAKANGLSASVDVIVTGQGQPFDWSFRNHVLSVLSKQGCNGGACHGARAGQKGFRLTLFGFDAETDYLYLTKQAGGRRVTPSDPGRSLILTKPTGLLPHKGGVRLDSSSLEYRVLAEWIAAGTPGPKDTDPQITGLEVFPKQSMQQVGGQQQLVVLATFSDGHIEDATRWSKFTAVSSSVSTVDERGLVKLVGSGEGAIKVWFLNWNAVASMTVPFDQPPSTDGAGQALTAGAAPQHNFIDQVANEKLAALRLPVAPACNDATFVRRVFLDTIGCLPTPEESSTFLTDVAPDRRERLADRLMARTEFVDYWSYRWSDLFLLSGERLRPVALKAFYEWIRQSVATNKPWNQFAAEIVTATGSTHENGAANFYALHQDPEDMAETVSQAFMGLSINCAKCHNHPLEKWTNDQYYGFANLFSRVRAKGWGGDYRGGDGLRVVYTDTQGELIQPSRGAPQPPRPLDGSAVPFTDPTDRRLVVARWLTSPENPYFGRAIANRIWANYLLVGLVEKVDDLRLTNPASNEVLLNSLAHDLAQHDFDVKRLMRRIVESATYQRSSDVVPGNRTDERFYSRYYPRRLKAEVILDALSQVTRSPTEFKDQPKGRRALQLPDAFVESYFLKAFGRPDRLITCECERSDEPSMTQVLHLVNGETLTKKLQAAGSVIEDAMSGNDFQPAVERLYWSALSRAPTPRELTELTTELAKAPAAERRDVLIDLYWSVLSTREFLFNH